MAGKLKPLDIARQVTPGKYADGDGLYLIVAGPTSRNWSYRYWINGKERWHGLGSLQDVSLKEARIKRDTARQDVRAGVDIVQAKRSAKEEAKAVAIATSAPTFEKCAQAYIDEHWDGWSKKHRAQWPSSLKRYAYPTIGQLTVAGIKPSHIHDLLKPIWVEKRETANRVRGRIETIIAKNVDVDDTDFRNPAELTKQLREKLPKRPKRVIQHHPALPYADASRFMTDLSGAAGTEQIAISRETIDELAGFSDRYAVKLLSLNHVRRVGLATLGPLMTVLGMKLIAVPDEEAIERYSHRRTLRNASQVRQQHGKAKKVRRSRAKRNKPQVRVHRVSV